MAEEAGKRSLRLIGLFFLLFVSGVWFNIPVARGLPPDFEDALVTKIGAPMEVAWTPDGRMLIPTKSGQLRIYESGVLLVTPALDLSSVMCTEGERALTGIAVHPNFAANHHIYIYYTFKKFGTCNLSDIDGPVNRLSRFILPDNNLVDRASEFVLLDTPPMLKDVHTGGDLKFGKDGYLYVTIGEFGSKDPAQDPGKLIGKVVRVTDSGDIPADNPFTGAGTARCNISGVPPAGSPSGTKCQEVFALGLRNPFRFAFDPNAAGVRFFINDVGASTWEEIDLGTGGANYGWPIREGPCAIGSTTNCGPPPTGMTNPIWWYYHDPAISSGNAAATGGAFVPNGLWPSLYDGTYLYTDYVWGKIFQLTTNGTGGFTQTEFATVDPLGFVSMRFGPYGNTQALYYATRVNGGQIRRIAFTGSLNRAPTASATANPAYGLLPLEVQFNGTTSSDPDGDPLSYDWDFGDGSVHSSDPSPVHIYSVEGTFTAALRVSDGRGEIGSVILRIDAGNTPPVPSIELPVEGTRFAVGESFTLHGTAVDPQEGQLPDTGLSWSVIRHHGVHTHPFKDATGNDVVITGPEPEDLPTADTSYLEIMLTAMDSKGLSQTVSRNLLPKVVNMTFQSSPSGLILTVALTPVTTPSTVHPWEAWNITIVAPDQADSSGQQWVFQSWSDGGAQSHSVVMPSSPANYNAVFKLGQNPVIAVNPSDDTYIRADSPTKNFGGSSFFQVDNSPLKHSLLKFSITGVGARTVLSAKLQLYNTNPSSKGGDIHRMLNNTWNEKTVTWNNAPSYDSAIVASFGSVAQGVWYETDITPLVTGDGTISIRITSPSSDGANYGSKESGASAPRLLVMTGSGGGGDTSAPSKPANLRTASVKSDQVVLQWDASTDNIGVTGYDIFREATYLATAGAVTTYTDTQVAPATTYNYQVRARDAAGNVSPLSEPLTVTTPAVSPTLTFTPTDDAYVRADSPDSNFGLATTLQADNSPVKHFLLKFSISGVGTRTVVSAKLRLYSVDPATRSGGEFHLVTDSTWSERTVTWNNAPSYDSTIVASIGTVSSGQWYEVDITSIVKGDGIISLRVTSPSSDGVDYSSKDGTTGFSPTVVITLS